MIDSNRATVNDNQRPSNGRPANDSRPLTDRGSRPRARRQSGVGTTPLLSLASDSDYLGEPVNEPEDEPAAGNGDEATSSQKTTGNTPTDSQMPEQRQQKVPIAQIAANLKHGPTILALRACGLGRNLPVEGWRLFLEDFLQRAGNPDDPIERVLVEQVALAHHAVAKLYVRAATGNDAATSQVCFEALTKLVAEIPRLALAVREYRGAASAGIVDMVGQPGRTPAGDQQIANLEKGADA